MELIKIALAPLIYIFSLVLPATRKLEPAARISFALRVLLTPHAPE